MRPLVSFRRDSESSRRCSNAGGGVEGLQLLKYGTAGCGLSQMQLSIWDLGRARLRQETAWQAKQDNATQGFIYKQACEKVQSTRAMRHPLTIIIRVSNYYSQQ